MCLQIRRGWGCKVNIYVSRPNLEKELGRSGNALFGTHGYKHPLERNNVISHSSHDKFATSIEIAHDHVAQTV